MPSWKLTKRKTSNSILQSFTIALDYEYVTKVGGITEKGYKIYLSLLGVIGKSSIYNAPPRKSYIWFESIEVLKKLDFVRYDDIKYNYNLTTKGEDMMRVLAKSLVNKGVPRI